MHQKRQRGKISGFFKHVQTCQDATTAQFLIEVTQTVLLGQETRRGDRTTANSRAGSRHTGPSLFVLKPPPFEMTAKPGFIAIRRASHRTEKGFHCIGDVSPQWLRIEMRIVSAPVVDALHLPSVMFIIPNRPHPQLYQLLMFDYLQGQSNLFFLSSLGGRRHLWYCVEGVLSGGWGEGGRGVGKRAAKFLAQRKKIRRMRDCLLHYVL